MADRLAYMEEVVLARLDRPAMERVALVDLCERSLYRLARNALDDDELREGILARMQAPP